MKRLVAAILITCIASMVLAQSQPAQPKHPAKPAVKHSKGTSKKAPHKQKIHRKITAPGTSSGYIPITAPQGGTPHKRHSGHRKASNPIRMLIGSGYIPISGADGGTIVTDGLNGDHKTLQPNENTDFGGYFTMAKPYATGDNMYVLALAQVYDASNDFAHRPWFPIALDAPAFTSGSNKVEWKTNSQVSDKRFKKGKVYWLMVVLFEGDTHGDTISASGHIYRVAPQ